jgi:hypothetical protein
MTCVTSMTIMVPPKRKLLYQYLRLTAGATALLLSALLVAAFVWIKTAPTLPQLLPSDIPAAGETDIRWWWDATEALRRIPDVKDALQSAEQKH